MDRRALTQMTGTEAHPDNFVMLEHDRQIKIVRLTSTSQLISPIEPNLALPTVLAFSSARASCSFVINRGYEGDQPAPLRKRVKYGAIYMMRVGGLKSA
jgi:hypothetical protein